MNPDKHGLELESEAGVVSYRSCRGKPMCLPQNQGGHGGSPLRSLILIAISFLFILTNSVQAEPVQVAVAANFLGILKKIAIQFEQETGHKVIIVSGSTGKLYTQVTHGAPFDIFLSADASRPKLLEDRGFAVPGSKFVYAVGKLILWSPDPAGIKSDGIETLRDKKFDHLAMANPKTAPYGKAAVQVMQALGLWDKLSPLVVQGEDIGQVFQFVITKNADLGFVALSQVLASNNINSGSRWDVPDSLHEPLTQEAVLLKHGQNNPAAHDLMVYLRGAKSAELIERAGYGLK